MNVISLQEGRKTIEERKRCRLRKEMNIAYKKNNQYHNVSKQSIADFINKLLEEDNKTIKTENPTTSNQSTIEEMEMNEPSQPFHIPINTLPLVFYITPTVSTEEQVVTNEEENEPISRNISPIDIPERFLRNFNERIDEESLFGKNIERQIFQRVYKTAISKYTFHMEMAQSNFHLYEPTFSQTA